MRDSNRHATAELQRQGYDEILWFPHTRHGNLHYSKKRGNYRGIDLWNMWDGECINSDGEAVHLAVKTNRWDSAKKINAWLQDKKNFKVLAINVKTKENFRVEIREYCS